MSDDHDHTIATVTATGEETPYGVRINAGGHTLRADEPVGRWRETRRSAPGSGVS